MVRGNLYDRETPAERLKVMSRCPGSRFAVVSPFQVTLDAEDPAMMDFALVRARAAATIMKRGLSIVTDRLHAVLTLAADFSPIVEACAWCPPAPVLPGVLVSHGICEDHAREFGA